MCPRTVYLEKGNIQRSQKVDVQQLREYLGGVSKNGFGMDK
ncbi:hypothetical protein Krac_2633 [Ktedonobacter racemifer DSM 44963]|uniref:Uncharacterized protein n=1 Tax=Ktedonobacter racemifer DSM 44963 TaxID=485913 RepID=D6TZ86_KTERA|nr:hypothetical protein Krac_2633 [Ktedonobacter racemifer DSM 44963]